MDGVKLLLVLNTLGIQIKEMLSIRKGKIIKSVGLNNIAINPYLFNTN